MLLTKIKKYSINRILLFFVLNIIISCGHWSFDTKIHITGYYYIIATDVKSQATVSIHSKEFNSYIGITSESIKKFAILNKKYIVAKNSKDIYFLIRIGDDFSKQLTEKQFDRFVKSINTKPSFIVWKKV